MYITGGAKECLLQFFTYNIILQPWLTPVNKTWPGSARQEEIHGDRNVVATLYDELVDVNKKK